MTPAVKLCIGMLAGLAFSVVLLPKPIDPERKALCQEVAIEVRLAQELGYLTQGQARSIIRNCRRTK